MLLEAGADKNAAVDGPTALMIAAICGHLDCVRLLLGAGANKDMKDDEGWTALMLATDEGHADCAQALLDAGADTDKTNNNGWTALMLAAREGHADCAQALLDAGADASMTIAGNETCTALDIAQMFGNDDVAKLLQCARSRQRKK